MLEVDGNTEPVAEVLRPLEGVLEVIADGRNVIARVTHGATAVPVLVTALERAGLTAQAVTLSRPTLDDVYLHYTGQRFAADAETGIAHNGVGS